MSDVGSGMSDVRNRERDAMSKARGDKAKSKKAAGKKSGGAKTAPKAVTPAQKDQRDSLRTRIDEADRGLVELLNKRAELVVEVGKIKRDAGLPIYVPNREAQVLSKVLKMNTGPLPGRAIEGVYRELMSGSFRLELPLRIGFLGPAGSYSHLAAVRPFFGQTMALGG